MSLGFRVLGLGGPYDKDYSILRYPYFGKRPYGRTLDVGAAVEIFVPVESWAPYLCLARSGWMDPNVDPDARPL